MHRSWLCRCDSAELPRIPAKRSVGKILRVSDRERERVSGKTVCTDTSSSLPFSAWLSPSAHLFQLWRLVC